jgi:MFS family permease
VSGNSPGWSPWRTVTWFGLVSLAADMVYEGARSVTGPYLAALGASALAVGLITGAGEAAALAFRLVSGPLADRSGRYWSLTILGYAMTALCVPLLALAPFLGAAGLVFAAVLVVLERTGKAIRSPAKSALLARAAKSVGRGRGIAVHKALDQVGAFAGPLVVAGIIALTARTWPAFLVLAIPGAVAVVLLVILRARTGEHLAPGVRTASDEGRTTDGESGLAADVRLPREFYRFALACAVNTLGLMTFGLISFHLVETDIVPLAAVPLVYAGAMAIEAVAALGTGFAYDRWGGRVLYLVPILVASVPWLTLSTDLGTVGLGIMVWGSAMGILDSTVKALVADLVPQTRLATAYGVFAAFQGVGALLGGAVAGWLYAGSRLDLVSVLGIAQGFGLVLLVSVLHGQPRRPARLANLSP